MNWLGAGLASVLAAVLGAALGTVLHVEARLRGIDFPPIVGVLAGVAAALASRQRSGLRGVLVASLSVWAAAVGEVLAGPSRSVLSDILRFNERLSPLRAFSYVVCAATAALFASRSARSNPKGVECASERRRGGPM